MSFDLSHLSTALLQYFCLLFALTVHEAAHATTADRCGDPTGRLLGRISLNPIVHMDMVGTLVMPLLMIFLNVPFLFGWAKPVPFTPRNLNNIRRDPVLIALAGPVSNLLLAALFVFLTRITLLAAGTGLDPNILVPFLMIFKQMILINLVLAAFNMIPVPPLDGHHVLYYFLPESGQRVLEQIGPFGILIAVFVASPLLRMLWPAFAAVLRFAGFAA